MTLLQTPVGIEIEYMLVQAQSLDVEPAAPRLLSELAGEEGATDAPGEHVSWSNELVEHVVESKVAKPVVVSDAAGKRYHQAVTAVAQQVQQQALRLLPTGAHPWMDPSAQTHLWNGEYAEHYRAYHENFNCYKHGFANLQSIHLNLPFHSEAEFGQLLRAIRLVLPLVPALCASTPILEGRVHNYRDARLFVYASNQKGIPEITGEIIPEQIYTYEGYRTKVLERIYRAADHLKHAKVLQTEQLNSRGCIARFDRNTLEIRLCDSQECVRRDWAVAYGLLQALQFILERQEAQPDHPALTLTETELKAQLLKCAREAEETAIDLSQYAAFFGVEQGVTAQELWQHLVAWAQPASGAQELHKEWQTLVEQGTLATRMLKKLDVAAATDRGVTVDRSRLTALYTQLGECLQQNQPLRAT